VLLAISWGGKVAVGLQRRYPGLNDALALLCPGFFARVQPSLRQKLGILWSRLVRPTRLFPIPLSDPELFTSNPRWLEFLRHDPLALHQATARLLLESVRLDLYLRLAAPRVCVPTLLMLAGQDRIVDNQRIRRLAARFAGPCTILEYPDAQHTLEFEPRPEVFVDDLLRWLRTVPDNLA